MIDVKTRNVYKAMGADGTSFIYVCLYAEKKFSILLEISRNKLELVRYLHRNFANLTLL